MDWHAHFGPQEEQKRNDRFQDNIKKAGVLRATVLSLSNWRDSEWVMIQNGSCGTEMYGVWTQRPSCFTLCVHVDAARLRFFHASYPAKLICTLFCTICVYKCIFITIISIISHHIPPKKTLLGKYSTWVCAESGHTPHLQFQVEEAYWTTDHWLLGYLILDRSVPLLNYNLTLQ